MDITSAAIAKNRVTIILATLLVIAGILAYAGLPKAQDPGFTVRTAVVSTSFPGASPERVEQLVTDKIETKVQEMPEVDSVTSDTRTGISIINVNFKESYTEMQPIFDDLRRKVQDVESELPDGARRPRVNDEFGDVFGSVYALYADGYSNAELKDIADEIRDRLLLEGDVAKVSIHGAREEVIFAEYDDARLAALNLSPTALSNLIGSINILSAGGNLLIGRERIVLEPTGNYESIEELENSIINLPDNSMVYLGDIVNIYREYRDPPASQTRVNGEAGVVIAVSMREGGDILKLGQRLDVLIPEIESRYPWGVQLEKIWFQADLVETNIDGFVSSLMQAIGIVVIVMVAFLGLRTGLVVATLIPVTMIVTFFVMQIFGITVNQISLAALIIALGLLVDNAIVIVESTLVKRAAGVGAVKAAVDSGKELRYPLLISSLTTAAAFMPIALAESAVGEYTADIFYVVTIALLLSWIFAMTLVPLLTTVTLKVEANNDEDSAKPGRWGTMYVNILQAALRFRALFLAGVVAVFVASIWALGFVPALFVAPSEDPIFTGKIELPLGTSIEASEEAIVAIDEFIRDTYYAPENGEQKIKNWMVYIGEGGPRFTLALDPPNQNPANSFLIANTMRGEQVEEVIVGLREFLSANFPDMIHQLARLENGPPVGYPIQIRVSGPDIDELYRVADGFTDALYADPAVLSVKNTWGLKTKKLVVDVNQQRALRAGVSNNDVAYSLEAGLAGIDLSEYREGDKLIPITLRTVKSDREDLSRLDGLTIYSRTSNTTVPLRQVADVRLAFEPGIIERRDRERTITLKAQLNEGFTAADATARLIPTLDTQSAEWPADFRYEIGGESEESADSNAAIAAKLPIALMAIVMLLVFQFNSARRPVIILATIPLGLIGVSIGLLVARSTFGFFTILGIIALAGIIINNAIVLIDRIKIEIEEFGKDPYQGVVDACLQRLRPILLTTATTVLGMMPLWWGGTAMFETMAVSMIFGLLFATLLTLLVVPVMYAVFFRVPQSG
ncbi:MAG: efflux RND transporter permease subunit [Pseudomonadota bacterium]